MKNFMEDVHAINQQRKRDTGGLEKESNGFSGGTG